MHATTDQVRDDRTRQTMPANVCDEGREEKLYNVWLTRVTEAYVKPTEDPKCKVSTGIGEVEYWDGSKPK